MIRRYRFFTIRQPVHQWALLVLFMVNIPASADQVKNNCVLNLGWGSWPPYQSGEIGKKPQGIQIDLVELIAEKAGCKLNYIKQSFSENLASVARGDVDIIMDTSVTEERKSIGYFTHPYRQEVLALYLKLEFIPQCQLKSLSGLINSGIRIGLNEGNIYGEEISSVQEQETLASKLVYSKTNDGLYELLLDNKLDGFFEDPAVLSYNLRRRGIRSELQLCQITQKSATVSFLLSKKTTTPELVERFNQAIEEVKKSPTYRANWIW